MAWTGGCLCGAVRFRSESEPSWVAHCHCEMCRRHFGGVMGSFVGFPEGTIEWLGETRSRYRSSDTVHRGFCPRCGSTLTFERDALVDIAVGALDDPERLTPGQTPDADPRDECHIYTESQIPWLKVDDALPRHPRRPPGYGD